MAVLDGRVLLDSGLSWTWHPMMANGGCMEQPRCSSGGICMSRYNGAIEMGVESEVLMLRS